MATRKRPKLGIYLKPRDLQVMETLWRYRILREATVHRLCFPTVKDRRKVQERLKKLSEEGYLGRRFPPVAPREGADGAPEVAPGAVYWVERPGVERVLGSPLDDEHQERLKVNRALSKWKDHRLAHPLDVSDVRACLELALEASEGVALTAWYDEHDKDAEGPLLQRKVVIPYGEDRERPFTLCADACFVLEEEASGKQQLFFLEIDEGTESARKRWKEQKVPAYRAYLGQGFEDDFAFHGAGFRVLTVTRSRAGKDQAKRKKTLVGATYRAGGRGQFWVATFDQVMPGGVVTGEHFLAGRIWQRARLEEMKGGREVALRGELFHEDESSSE